jgi:hypothetical protein
VQYLSFHEYHLSQCMHVCKHPLAESIFLSSQNPAQLSSTAITLRPRDGSTARYSTFLISKQSGSQLGLPPTSDEAAADSAQEPKVGQHCLRTQTPPSARYHQPVVHLIICTPSDAGLGWRGAFTLTKAGWTYFGSCSHLEIFRCAGI